MNTETPPTGPLAGPRQEPFAAPEGYFDALPARLQAAIQTQPARTGLRSRLGRRWLVGGSLATAGLAALLAFWLWPSSAPLPAAAPARELLAQVDRDAAYDAIEEDLGAYDDALMMDALAGAPKASAALALDPGLLEQDEIDYLLETTDEAADEDLTDIMDTL